MGELNNISERRSRTFIFRMSESELASLQENAGRTNMNVSQYIRYTLFSRAGKKILLPQEEKNDKKNISKYLLSCQESVKKACAEIEKYIRLYSDSIEYSKEKGDSKFNENYTSRITKTIVHNLSNITDSFNGMAVLLGGKAIEKSGVATGIEDCQPKGFLIEGFSVMEAIRGLQTKLRFMWKSSLVGDVVNVFPEKEIRPGVKTISFTLKVEEYLNGQKGQYLFLVEANKQTYMMSGIGQGSHATVYGTTAIRQKSDGKVDLYMFADSIVG